MTGPASERRPAAAAGSRPHWSSLAGVVISVGLLAWVLRDVSAEALLREIRAARLVPLAAAVLIATGTFPVRVFRWRLLLRADDGDAIPAAALWHAVAMGFMANNVLPLRAGEVVRSYAVSRLAGARFSAAFSSVAVERVFDGFAVLALLALALFVADLPDVVTIAGASVSISRAAATGGLACLAALVAAGLVVAWPLAAERIIRRLVPSRGLAHRLVELIEGVRHGLAVLHSPGRLLAVAAWSLGLWLMNAYAFFVAFAAFDLPVNYGGALLLQGLLVLGIAVPSTPGFIGVFEAVIKAVLLLYGVDQERAAAYALVYHATTFVPITLLGLWSLARMPIGLRELRHPPPAA